MSRKTVAFSVPAPRGPSSGAADSGSQTANSPDAWVRDRAIASPEEPPENRPEWLGRAAGPTIDLAAERTLSEVVLLSFLAPFALGWFWLLHAMAGRARF